MMGFIVFIHVVCCVFLMVAILMQSGRGGGLTEGFSQAESMFGAKTNEFMVKITITLAAVFLVTSLSIGYLSSKKERSLLENADQTTVVPRNEMPMPSEAAPAAETPAAEAPAETPAPQPAQ